MQLSSYQCEVYYPGSIGESRSWSWKKNQDPQICAIAGRKEIVSRINGNNRSEMTTRCNPLTNDFIILEQLLERWNKARQYTHATGAPT